MPTMGFKQTRQVLVYVCFAVLLTDHAWAKQMAFPGVRSKGRTNRQRKNARVLGHDIFSMKKSKSEAGGSTYPQSVSGGASEPTPPSPRLSTLPPTFSPSASPTKRPTPGVVEVNNWQNTPVPTRSPSSGAANTMTMTFGPSRTPSTINYFSGPGFPSSAPISPTAYLYDVEAYDENGLSPSNNEKGNQNASVDDDNQGKREGLIKFGYFVLSVTILFCCCICFCCVAARFKRENGEKDEEDDDDDEKKTIISESTYNMDHSLAPVPSNNSPAERASDFESMVSSVASCDFSTAAEASESGSPVNFISPVVTKSRSIDSVRSESSNNSRKNPVRLISTDTTRSVYSNDSAASNSHISMSVALSRSRSRGSTASSANSADEFFSSPSRSPNTSEYKTSPELMKTLSGDSASCASIDRADRKQPIFRTFDDPSEHSAPTVMIVNRASARQTYNLQSMIDSVSSSSSSLGKPSELFSGTRSVGSMSHGSRRSQSSHRSHGSRKSHLSHRSHGSKRSQSSHRSHGSKISQSSQTSHGSTRSQTNRKSRGDIDQVDPVITCSRSNSSVSSSQFGPPLSAPCPDSKDYEDGGLNQPVYSKIKVQSDATSKVGALLTMPHPQDREIKPSRSFESYHRYRDNLLTSLRSRENSWDESEEDGVVDYVEY